MPRMGVGRKFNYNHLVMQNLVRYFLKKDLSSPNQVQRLVLVADENRTKESIQIPLDESIDLSTKGAGFDITFVASGGNDEWGEPCLNFPSEAMNAFYYAANIWASDDYLHGTHYNSSLLGGFGIHKYFRLFWGIFRL